MKLILHTFLVLILLLSACSNEPQNLEEEPEIIQVDNSEEIVIVSVCSVRFSGLGVTSTNPKYVSLFSLKFGLDIARANTAIAIAVIPIPARTVLFINYRNPHLDITLSSSFLKTTPSTARPIPMITNMIAIT